MRRIQLQALSWPEVWQWIRRNLPVLTRYREEDLRGFYSDLSHLEQWEQLAAELEGLGNAVAGDLPDLVARVAARLPGPGETAPPPIFGGDAATEPALSPAEPPLKRLAGTRRALRVAVAGTHTEGRQAEFSRAVTGLAAEHWVSGRVVASESGDSASSLGELLSLPSAFGEGVADSGDIVRWMEQAADADVVVLDFGSTEVDAGIEQTTRDLVDVGRLVIAAGGNSQTPTYPAWLPGVLAVGALEGGVPAAYSPYFAKDRKPDLYTDGQATASAVSQLLGDPTIQGTSVAALNAAAAAILVWATDRGQDADDVRRVLIGTARTTGDDAPRVLDLTEALKVTRRDLVLDTLQVEAVEMSQVLAETGLRPEVAVPLIDELVEEGRVSRTTVGGVEVLEDRVGPAQEYDRLRTTRPAGWDRTRDMGRVVRRAGDLARSGRLTAEKVQSLWASGHDGRRIMALGAMDARPELASLDIIISGIVESRSAFEQYHALKAGLSLAPSLDAADYAKLLAAAEVAANARDLKGTDRMTLIRKLRALKPPP